MMEFLPVLELVDRLCIARVKYEKTNGANQIELDWYEDQWRKLPANSKVSDAIQSITEIHKSIWNLESELKSGVESSLSLEEIGRRAIQIRDFNSKRVALKNSVAELLNHPVRETKHNHLSDVK